MIVVLDASAAVKLVLVEDHSEDVRRLWDEPLTFLAPTIVVPEVAAALGAAEACGRLTPAEAQRAHRAWVDVLDDINLVMVDIGLAIRAAEVARDRPVRGMDAIYLATALLVAGQSAAGLLSYDDRQRGALVPRDGVDLLPA